ncbi:MAG TPA: hypothetical protein VMH32_17355 [Burkholderiales bacterium]|nr:hypothetical protein [Burkholderiales bacterium]
MAATRPIDAELPDVDGRNARGVLDQLACVTQPGQIEQLCTSLSASERKEIARAIETLLRRRVTASRHTTKTLALATLDRGVDLDRIENDQNIVSARNPGVKLRPQKRTSRQMLAFMLGWLIMRRPPPE